MNCQEFQIQLPTLISSGGDVESHPHLQTGELCRSVVKQLEKVGEVARMLFPRENDAED